MAQPSKEASRRYDQSPKGKYRRYKSCARQRGIEFKLSFEEFVSLWGGECHYCGYKIFTIGLDRVLNSDGYSLSTVVRCCEICNRIKSDLTQERFFEIIGNIAARHRLGNPSGAPCMQP